VSSVLGIPQRLGGANRRETAISIAKELVGNKKNVPVVVVNENSFVDAISIAPIAAVKGWPILLTNGKELSSEIATFLDEEKPDSILVVGGESVVSKSVFEALSSKAPSNSIVRLGGRDRFETNALVLQTLASNSTEVAFANGDSDDVIDALAGAALGIPIVLVHEKDQLTNSQNVFLHQIGQVQSEIFGGSSVIAQNIRWN
ncbi:MAG: cell wall-binding repeat-containing protein, partial [Desulfosporosinus sp.]